MMRRQVFKVGVVVVALLLALGAAWAQPKSSEAAGYTLREVGGYGMVLRDTPTYEYGSLDSRVNGTARAGEIVYLNGWQIGVYHVADYRWIAASSVQPIIDANGRPLVNYITRDGNQYYANGKAITVPGRRLTEAEKFLRNPTGPAPVIYQGGYVPIDQPAELVDTSRAWFSPGNKVVATMRVTDLYDYIYLRTAPSNSAPLASFYAYAGEILTAYEVQGGWYRIGANVWAPSSWGRETLMVAENVANYAPAEYYNGGKWISVDLDRQRLTAWEGSDVVHSAPVKTGKYGYATPTGRYKVYAKVPNERMAGSDYDLLDVSWTMYFTSSRVAIHSAYWHNNYNGRPGSHGCVNTRLDDAKWLFMWAPNNTTVVTHNAYQYDAQDIADAKKWSEYER